MRREEGLRVFGLGAEATDDEIEAAFRKKAHEVHPDKGGDDSAFQRLVEARDAALGATGGALVPFTVVRDLVQVVTAPLVRQAEREERKAERVATFDDVVRIRTSPLRRARRNRASLGLVAGAIGIASQALRASPGSASGPVALILLGVFGGVAAMAGLLALSASARIRSIEDSVADVNDTLESKGTFVRVFLGISKARREDGKIEEAELDSAILEWASSQSNPDGDYRDPFQRLLIPRRSHASMGSAALLIGPSDFGKLLLSKGRELDLLDTVEIWDGHELRETYSLRLPTA